jgi:ATP-dependent RNA helicase DDX23/PRP28
MPKGKELEAIKQQYLGKVKVKKPTKHSEKHARIFKFGWDDDEDTSSDLNLIYSSRADGALLFGRGACGGLDAAEQKDSTSYMRQVLERRRNGDQMTDDEFRAQRTQLDLKQREQDKDNAPGSRAIHWSAKPLEDMTERDWRIVREDHDIFVQGGRVPLPARSWDEMNLLPQVMDGIRALGFERPSPIQMAAIPIGMQQRDLIGVAETGSGKTAAFVIPMLMFILKQDPSKLAACSEEGPLAVVMAPTCELAQQIEEQTVKLCRYTPLRSVAVVGGNSIEDQATKMRAGCEVVIATPGRLLHCLRNRYVVFNQCNYLVLDEADRMIDMGFEPQVEAVIDSMNCGIKSEIEAEVIEQERKTTQGEELHRVTIMFSATMPRQVENLAVKYMRFPATIRIGDRDTGKNRKISQHVHLLSGDGAKKAMLLKLARMTAPPIIVFANSKIGCDKVRRILNQSGFSAVVLHLPAGNKANVSSTWKDSSRARIIYWWPLMWLDVVLILPISRM